jgi:SPP1 family predicted phage head-tail adaptor
MAVSFKPPRIGTFSKRMAIQAIATDQTADGGTNETATLFTSAWCSIESLDGQELWLMKAQQDKVSHIIRMAWQPGIVPQMRGIYNGRTFNFTSVIDVDERHVELRILATEVVEPQS